MKKTKIICTLGPAVDNDEMIKKLALAGMDCARLNFSHGTHAEQFERMERVRRVSKEIGKAIPILLDTKGPEIRLGLFEQGSIVLNEGDSFTLTSDVNDLGNESHIGITFSHLAQNVKVGDRILIDDGKVELIVKELQGANVECLVQNGGKLSNRKSLNVPNIPIAMDYLSPNDIKDIEFGIAQDVDFIAASFVRSKQDVLDLRGILEKHHKTDILIISKIENTQGIENLDEILEVSDGIMVARGDMGVEVPFEKLPAIQKDIISKCYRTGKIVVTATQMLESMTTNPRPTRAEVSDVANAIYDRTVGIMLSGESAAGKYPKEAVAAMREIAINAEESINFAERFYRSHLDLGSGALSSICNAAVNASFQVNAKAIICITQNGVTARMLSAYRPSCPIIAVVVNEKAYRQLQLAWGVYPVLSKPKDTTDEIMQNGLEKALESKIVGVGDTVVITSGSAIGEQTTDMMKIHVIK